MRVWSTGLDAQWIAELGEPPVNHPLDKIFESEDEARSAGLEAGKEARTNLAAALRDAGAAEIADAPWEPLTLHPISSEKDTAAQVITVA